MDQLGLWQSSVNEEYLQERLISRAIYLFVHQMQNAHGFFQSPSFTRHLTTFFTQVSILRHHKGFQFHLVTAYVVKVQRLRNYRMNKLKKTTKIRTFSMNNICVIYTDIATFKPQIYFVPSPLL